MENRPHYVEVEFPRGNREILRNYLESQGFDRSHSSLWGIDSYSKEGSVVAYTNVGEDSIHVEAGNHDMDLALREFTLKLTLKELKEEGGRAA